MDRLYLLVQVWLIFHTFKVPMLLQLPSFAHKRLIKAYQVEPTILLEDLQLLQSQHSANLAFPSIFFQTLVQMLPPFKEH